MTGEEAALASVALAASHYEMPLMAYAAHLRRTREEFGEEAAQLDLAFALELRRLRIEKLREAAEQ